MGGTCSGEAPNQVTELPSLDTLLLQQFNDKHLKKITTKSIRFGNVERIRSAATLQNNTYKFIIPIKDSQQFIKVQCPIISTYADQFSVKYPMLSIETINYQEKCPPIMDICDQTKQQIHFSFKTVEGPEVRETEDFMVKIYNYKNYRDTSFVEGLYEASLYKIMDSYLKSSYWLKDFFLIEKGELSSMVFITNKYLCSLADIIRYRKTANFRYSPQQEIYVIERILNSYKQLHLNNIIHRDIRPSKIYLFDSSQKYQGVYRLGQSYQFSNLESARKFTKSELKEISYQKEEGEDTEGMLMTLRGVPVYSSEEVCKHMQAGNQLCVYNYNENERVQLAKTCAAVVLLDLVPKSIDHSQIKKNNKFVSQIISLLMESDETIDKIHQRVSKKIQGKALEQVKKVQPQINSILSSDFQIASTYLPSLIAKANKERIAESQIECFMSLHRQNQFIRRFQKLMDINDASGNNLENIAILDRLGKYYEGLGAKNNDYFVEQVQLLLMLCKKQRINGFPGRPYLDKLDQILQKKSMKAGLTSQTKLRILLEEAYDCFSKQNPQKAQQIINEAMMMGSQINPEIQIQVDLIQAKILIQLQVNEPEQAQQFAEKGLQLSNNASNFRTKVQMLDSRSTFQYLLGLCFLKKCSGNSLRIEKLQKYLTRAQSYLNAAKKIKSQIPQTSVVPLGKIIESLGEMNIIRESYEQAAQEYERVYRLYSSSETPIHEDLEMKILQKQYKIHLDHLNDSHQQKQIEERLKKYREKRQKMRDPRKNFQKIKYLSKRQRDRQNNRKKSWLDTHHNPAYQQIQEENEQEDRSLMESRKMSSVHHYEGTNRDED